MNLSEVGCEIGRCTKSDSGSCPVPGFGTSGVEPSGSATRVS
jgi:hypothetical protein